MNPLSSIILCRRKRVVQERTHHIDGVDVGELVEELTTAEGELGVRLEELLSGGQKDTEQVRRSTTPLALLSKGS